MKKLAVFLTIPFLLVGCEFGCEVEKTISSGLASAIAPLAGCPASALPVIQASVQSLVDVGGICTISKARHWEEKSLKHGAIAAEICPLVSATAVAYLGTAIPASWVAAGCNPQAGSLATIVTGACNLLPF
jgi:hypothetical protein